MDRLLIVDPTDITLRFEIGRKSVAVFQLKNVMHTMPVAFKVQTSAPKMYTIKPPHAIIAPLGVMSVEIVLNPQKDLPNNFPRCLDKFSVKSVVIPGGFSKKKNVSLDWFTSKKKALFNDTGLKIILVGREIIRSLVSRGCMEEIREVLERDRGVAEAADEQGFSCMHVAISMRRPEIVQLLLEFRVNLELKSRTGQTPLQLAAQEGNTLITELLLANGANTEAKNESGWSALHYAAVKGYTEIMRLLIDYGADIDASVKDGRTALHMAVAEGHKHCVRLLLDRVCNVNARSADGGTALHTASARGHAAFVEILLQKGACKDVRNSLGRTPYDDAVDSRHTMLFEMLRLGDSLRQSARKGELNVVKEGVQQGAVVNGEDQYAWTALHRAAFKGHISVVKFLIENGADLKLIDEEGYTVLHMAVESGQKDVVQLLLNNGAKVNEKTKRGLTPVQLASTLQYGGILRILQEAVDWIREIDASTCGELSKY